LDALSEAGNNNFTVVTIPGARHSFLVEQPDGSLRYTDRYWLKMLEWLADLGIALPASRR
jgi:dienelactone hydrolase